MRIGSCRVDLEVPSRTDQGVYWATYGVDGTDAHLFPGDDEYERFRKVLGRVLEGPQIAAELERLGSVATDISTHSMRKGTSTYCSSGSTACPSAVAVHLQAGWSMGGVQDRYLRHDAAGDMFVGRRFVVFLFHNLNLLHYPLTLFLVGMT